MKHLPDNIIIQIMKYQEVRDALALNEALDNRFEPLPERLWEFYLNRDFPDVAQPLNRDFEGVYQRELAQLKEDIEQLPSILDDLLKFDIWEINTKKAFQYIQKELDPALSLKMKTVQEVVDFRMRLYEEIRSYEGPIYKAMHAWNNNLLKFLITTVKILAQGAVGHSAFRFAVMSGNIEISELLIKAGADINHADAHGATPLMLAVRLRRFEIISMLLKYGANVNTVDSLNWSALIYASNYADAQIVKLLLSAGADTHVKDYQGWGVLEWAKGNKNIEAVAVLQFHTVKPLLLVSKAERADDLHQGPKKQQTDKKLKM